MPARVSERPGACPVFLPCEVAQPPKPSAAGEFLPESKNVPATPLTSFFLTSLLLTYLLTSYLRVGDIFQSGRFQRPAALVILRFSILLARRSLEQNFVTRTENVTAKVRRRP